MDNISFVYIDKMPEMKLISYTDILNISLENSIVETATLQKQIA